MMGIQEWLVPVAGVIIALGLATIMIHAFATFDKDFTLQDYLREHPDCKVSGGVKCCHCGGRGVYLRTVGRGIGAVLNSHVCRTCGRELYRSRT